MKAHCNYSIHSLHNIPAVYDTRTLENIQNHFLRKMKHFMFGYPKGLAPEKELDVALKKYQMQQKE